MKYKVIKTQAIIFAKVWAAIFLERKRIAENFLIDNNMMAFVPEWNIYFIYHLFNQIRLSKFAQVGALPSYNSSDLSIIKVQMPCVSEQEKIASFLTEIDVKIEMIWKELEEAKKWKKGLLQEMFI
jgi:type I restriction enzyme S subunit